MKVYITYNNKEQLKKLDVGNFPDVEFFMYSSVSKKDQNKAYSLKGHWAAKLDPFVFIEEDEKPIKAFYSETGEDTINSLIDYLSYSG